MTHFKQTLGAVLIGGSVLLAAGCASHPNYEKAFASESAVKGSSQSFETSPTGAFKAAKLTLVKQGFTIDHADMSGGIIKASRNLAEKSDGDVSYNIVTTVDVTGDAANAHTQVTLAASQQTVLHRKWHTWWHLLFIIPLFPTGTEYQTVVTHEGNVTDPGFYNDFFKTLKTLLPPPEVKTAPLVETPVVAAPVVEAKPAVAAESKPAPVADAAPVAPAAATPEAAPAPAPAPAPAAP